MSRKISCTVTVGASSERHNHDLEYRQTLEHVHGCAEDVIEIIPYRSYEEQIDEIMRPFIEDYNRKLEERYKEALERYNSGKIKTKPCLKRYVPMSFDYCEKHRNRQYFNRKAHQFEAMRLWRGLIFGLGDQKDRQNNLITREEAVDVMRKLVKQWPELFPNFILLGCTIHLDEKGFYHCHIDYFPLFEKPVSNKQILGLRVSCSHDGALEYMGYEPEQSIINGKEKAPIRFNAFRNQIYLVAEAGLNAHGIRLEYGVSKRKNPNIDSSVHQSQKDWQNIQDGVIERQRMKNHLLDIVNKDMITPEHIADAIRTADQLQSLFAEMFNEKRIRLGKNNVVVEHRLFDQLKSYIQAMIEDNAYLFKRIENLSEQLLCFENEANCLRYRIGELEQEIDAQETTIERYKNENHELKYKINHYCNVAKDNEQRKQFMVQCKIDNVSMEEKYLRFLHPKTEITR